VKIGVLQTECTEGRDAVALCNLIEYEEAMPKQYQVGSEVKVMQIIIALYAYNMPQESKLYMLYHVMLNHSFM